MAYLQNASGICENAPRKRVLYRGNRFYCQANISCLIIELRKQEG